MRKERKFSWKQFFCIGFLYLILTGQTVIATLAPAETEQDSSDTDDNEGEALSYASGLLSQKVSEVLSQLQARYSVVLASTLATLGSLKAQANSARAEVDKLKLENDRKEKQEIRSLEAEKKSLEEQAKALS